VTFLKQLAAVTMMGLRTMPQRLRLSIVIVIGMACVVAVTISILSLSTGIVGATEAIGRDDQAIVLSKGSQFEPNSSIPRDSVVTIGDAPGVKRDADGKPIVSAEFFATVPLTRKTDRTTVYLALRGIGPGFFVIHPEVKLISGRMFTSGKRELLVGANAHAHTSQTDLGERIRMAGGEWTVTGIYDSGGDGLANQSLADAATVMSAMRSNVFRSVWVQLQRPDLLQQFKTALTTNPALAVDVMSGTEFWDFVAKNNTQLLRMIGYVVGVIMGAGAAFAALNTMLSVVGTRSVEIATLRAIGFDGRAVVISVLMEALTLAAAGAVVGAAAAWIIFNGRPHEVGASAVSLAVTPSLMGYGIAYACVLGFIGGAIPAIRAATMPVTSALRAT
jgi:putative ABC transport system permease protein